MESKEHQGRMAAEFEASVDPLVDGAMELFEARFDEVLDNVISKVGVLCLTEDPLSRSMWSYYADSGSGFVVGFDVNHPFFYNDGNSVGRVIRRVRYSDDHLDNFWRNPYYLFLIKNTDYQHEREWRMFRKLAECDFEAPGSPPVCLWNVPPAMIRSVTFGYAYNADWIRTDVEALRELGAYVEFTRARPNLTTGVFDCEPI